METGRVDEMFLFQELHHNKIDNFLVCHHLLRTVTLLRKINKLKLNKNLVFSSS